MLKRDETMAKLQYEEKLFGVDDKGTADIYVGDAATRNRIALAVIKHVIENILKWSPEKVSRDLSMKTITEMKLNVEWDNLDLPEGVRQSGDTKYLVKKLYPIIKADEKLAIMRYESVLISESNVTIIDPEQDAATRNRIALAVFRHAIERILGWTPEQASEEFTMQTVEDMKLKEAWANLDITVEDKETGSTKYIIEMLYPDFKF